MWYSSYLQPAEELIKEIAVLELEVVYLERYLLSLYRKTFDQQAPSLSTKNERFKSNSITHKGMFPVASRYDIMSDKDSSINHTSNFTSVQNSIENPPKEFNGTCRAGKLLDSSIHRCHSSMSQRSPGTSPPMRSVARTVDSFHSLPLSMLEVT